MLSNEDVTDILRLLDNLPYDEFDLRIRGFHIVLRRDAGRGWTAQRAVLSEPNVAEQPTTAPQTQASTGPAAADGGRADLHAVRAPLVGTFYRAPRPGAPPFVEIGGHVELDTVVGIIETMKLFNSVEAGVAGEVVEFCVENAEFADKDAVLMRVAPDQ
jgi:acetyl-CoA carboxylase biotin carboxyl carrier protein